MKQGNWKKVVKIVLNVLIWLFVAFSVVVTVLAFAAQRSNDGVPTINGKCYMTVLSPSMEPTFKEGDLIVGKKLAGADAPRMLEVGDVISYRTKLDLNGDGKKEEEAINSHRIVSIIYDTDGKALQYITQGDNRKTNPVADAPVDYQDVIAKWTGTRIPGLGGFLSFLQQPKGFLIVIVLPLILFFLYELFVFIKTLLGIKNSGKKVISAADEEVIKQKAIEEYLRQQQAAQNPAPAAPTGEAPAEAPETEASATEASAPAETPTEEAPTEEAPAEEAPAEEAPAESEEK